MTQYVKNSIALPTAKCTHFTNRIVVTDDKFGVFTCILLVLWLFTDGCELENMIILTNGRATGYHCMRTDSCACIDTYLGVYNGKSAYLDVIGKFGFGVNNSCWVYHD